jgi:hypothetical protein
MTDLKLPKLPDRTPVKLTLSISPDLDRALADYAAAYRETYGEAEPVALLVPYMIRLFLESDRGFAKAREAMCKAGQGDG